MLKKVLVLIVTTLLLIACNNNPENNTVNENLGAKLEFTTNPDIVFDTLIQGHSGFEKIIGFKNIGHKKLIITGIKSPEGSLCKPLWDKRFYLPGETGILAIKCFVHGTHLLNEIYIIKSNSITQVSDTATINGVVVGPPEVKLEIVK